MRQRVCDERGGRTVVARFAGAEAELMQSDVTSYPEVNAVLDLLRDQIQAILGDRLAASTSMARSSPETSIRRSATLICSRRPMAICAMTTLRVWSACTPSSRASGRSGMTASRSRTSPSPASRRFALSVARSRSSVLASHFTSRTPALTGWSTGTLCASEESPSPVRRRDTHRAYREGRIPFWCPRLRPRISPARRSASARRSQAYAVLTMCRAYHTLKTGDLASKTRSARWAENEWPAWVSLIQQARVWRSAPRGEPVDDDATLAETRRFVLFAVGECEKVSISG